MKQGRGVRYAILAVVAVFVIAVLAVFAKGWFTDITADRQGETQKEQQVEGNGAFRIQAYDKFYDQCASVEALEDQIRNTKTELRSTTESDRKLQLQTNLTALSNQRDSAIRQYNADARKSYTIAQFKASDLPARLDTNERTNCDSYN